MSQPLSKRHPQLDYLEQQGSSYSASLASSLASYTSTPTRPPAKYRNDRRWSNTHGVSAEHDPSPPKRANASFKTTFDRSQEHSNYSNYDHPFLSLRIPSSPPSFAETVPTALYYQDQQAKEGEQDVRPPTGGNYAPLFSPEKDDASEDARTASSVRNDRPQYPSNTNTMNNGYGTDVTFDRYTDVDSRIDHVGYNDIDDQVFADLLAKVNEVLGNVKVSGESSETEGFHDENLCEYALLRKVDEILKPSATDSPVQTSAWTDRCTTREDPIGGMIGTPNDDRDSQKSTLAKCVPSSDGFLQNPFMDEPPSCAHAEIPAVVTRHSASTPLPTLPYSAAEFLLPKINYVSFIGDNETMMESALEPLMQKYMLPPTSPNPTLPSIGHKRAEEIRRSTIPRGEQTTIAFEDQLSMASLEYMKRHDLLRTETSLGRRVLGTNSETRRSTGPVKRNSPLRVSSMPEDGDEVQGRNGVIDDEYANDDVLDLEKLKRLPKLLGDPRLVRPSR